MRPTTSLGAMPNFWRRTIDHMKRQTNVAIRMEGLRRPTRPFPLIQFSEAERVDHCKAMSDKSQGGFSKASMTFEPGHVPATDLTKSVHEQPTTSPTAHGDPPHILFKGSISTELPPNRPEIQRSGYAGWRTRDMGYSLFGKVLWDLGQYAYVALRVKSDGRKYLVNFQTESLVPTDLHQHLLPAKTPGQWETITIPFSSFVRTNYGMPVAPQKEMLLMKVRSVGISLTDRVQGPFELRIADVYATNTSTRQLERRDSGFDLAEPEEEYDSQGMMSEIRPKRKPGQPEKILI